MSKLKSECVACYQRGLAATHDMEKKCVAALKKMGVTVIVAPYEADPQLAYLCHIGEQAKDQSRVIIFLFIYPSI